MWRDSESSSDFLNFTELADQIATLVTNPSLLPVSVGVFGTWGTGKSTVLALTEQRLKGVKSEPIIVKFDAWLYQGFDDSKAALMEVVADQLLEIAREDKTLFEKIKEFSKRINYFRALSITTDFGIGMAFGVPPGLLTKAGSAIGSLVSGAGDNNDIEDLKKAGKEVASGWAELVKPKEERTPPKEIAAFRKEFGEILEKIGRPLILFIDNLDRCLPDVAIGTLEAIRLFLFIPGTAFVIAADEDMVRHSVKKHFDDINSRHVTDYLDKVIQVPLRVPQVSADDIRAYMYSLFVSVIAPDKISLVQDKLLTTLQQSWDGKKFTKEDIYEMAGKPTDLLEALSVSDRLAPILATAPNIGGNPRIVKRLLNAITLRKSLANQRKMDVDLATLAKLAVFERSTDAKASERLYRIVMEGDDISSLLDSSSKIKGARPELPAEWRGYEEFIGRWQEMEPYFSDAKLLKPALFLSRDVMAPSSSQSGMSENAKQALSALLSVDSVVSKTAKDVVEKMSPADRRLVMSTIITQLRTQDLSKNIGGVHGAIILSESSVEAKEELRAYVLTLNVEKMHKGARFLFKNAGFFEGK